MEAQTGRDATANPASLVRVLRADGRAVGGGFLVSNEGYVLTATFVVEMAQDEDPKAPVILNFPFSGNDTYQAYVEYRAPQDAAKESSEASQDIAVLRLTEPPPASARPDRIEAAPAAPGLEIRSYGFTENIEHGVWASGTVQGRVANGMLQVETSGISRGFGGSPIWDAVTGNVVGMVDSLEPGTGRSFAIPASELLDALARVPAFLGEVSSSGRTADPFSADMRQHPSRERLNIAARALADEWTQEDQLGYRDYATALADFIEDERTKKPLTIGIDAPWGMGKTTLMHMIKERVEENRPQAPRLPTVWFNAWKYDKEESLWAALALEILRQTQERLTLPRRVILWLQLNVARLNVRFLVLRLVRSLLLALAVALSIAVLATIVLRVVDIQTLISHPWRYIGLAGGLGALATVYNTIGKDLYRSIISPLNLKISDYVEQPNYEEKVGFFDQFERDFELVIHAVTKSGKKSLPLVVFIDDLDRAASPKPVEIFEAINMLLDTEQCVFVLGMDSQAVAKSIEAKYKDLVDNQAGADGIEPNLGRRFLEKIVQIPFVLPRVDPSVFSGFANRNLEIGEQQEAVVEERDKIVQAERRIEEEQRRGKSHDQAVESVQRDPGISAGAVRAADEDMRATVRAKSFGDSEEVQRVVADALPYLGHNPRKVKRFINLFKLQALIANRRGLLDDGTIQFKHLAKWVIISTRWPAVGESAIPDPDFLQRLIQAHTLKRELPAIPDPEERDYVSRERLASLLTDSRIEQLHADDELLELVKDLPSEMAEMQSYLYLTKITSSTSRSSDTSVHPQ